MSRFFDPQNDYVFKKLLGMEEHKKLLLHFLNAVLQPTGKDPIIDVTLINPFQAPDSIEQKTAILDLKCTDKDGKEYIVEMQVADKKDFPKRSLMYASRSYSNQLNRGEDYADLREVIFIAIVNFCLTNDPDYISTHLILDKKTHKHLMQDFSFHFIELPKFKKDETEVCTPADQWLYLFKYAKKLPELPMLHVFDEEVKEAFEVLESHNWTPIEIALYDKLEMDRQDRINEIARAKEVGIEEGKQIGIEEGVQKEKREMVKKLAEQGVSRDIIQKAAGLSMEEISELLD